MTEMRSRGQLAEGQLAEGHWAEGHWAEGHLTGRLFGQILGRIGRLAWHPT